MIEIAIILTVLGYILYVVLVIRPTSRKKKNALANLARLYERHRSRPEG
jgi:hypothetical protein